MAVSINGGILKWIVYSGKSYQLHWVITVGNFLGTTILGHLLVPISFAICIQYLYFSDLKYQLEFRQTCTSVMYGRFYSYTKLYTPSLGVSHIVKLNLMDPKDQHRFVLGWVAWCHQVMLGFSRRTSACHQGLWLVQNSRNPYPPAIYDNTNLQKLGPCSHSTNQPLSTTIVLLFMPRWRYHTPMSQPLLPINVTACYT